MLLYIFRSYNRYYSTHSKHPTKELRANCDRNIYSYIAFSIWVRQDICAKLILDNIEIKLGATKGNIFFLSTKEVEGRLCAKRQFIFELLILIFPFLLLFQYLNIYHSVNAITLSFVSTISNQIVKQPNLIRFFFPQWSTE